MIPKEVGRQYPLVVLTANIVAAYVRNHVVPVAGLGGLISGVHRALGNPERSNLPEPQPVAEVLKPAVPIRKSITDEFIICLEDGLPYRTLKRHLGAKYGMTPDEYRAKWGLPDDYPMVSPAYAEKRSQLARSRAFGQTRRK